MVRLLPAIPAMTRGSIPSGVSFTTTLFDAAENGFVMSRNRPFPVEDSTIEPERLEGDEAVLAFTMQDADGLFAEKMIRVRLTLRGAEDLPEINSPSLPAP